MLEEFLRPVPQEFQDLLQAEEGKFKLEVEFYKSDQFPDLHANDLVIIGLEEDRNSSNNWGTDQAPNRIRQALYQLQSGAWKTRIIDAGNIKAGETPKDSYTALSSCLEHVLKAGAIGIVLGGSHDITYAQYMAYENLEQTVNLAVVDRKFDLEKLGEELNSDTYLSHIILSQPNFLFNYSHIGYQSYYTSPDLKHLLDKMNFDSIRLGLLKNRIEEVEPIIRDADLVSLDMSSIRHADFQATKSNGPNGFAGDDICGIARYAGIADKVSSFGVYDYNPEEDRTGMGAELAAQIVWYFIDGLADRKQDYPFANRNDYTKYHVVGEEQDLNFYKSPLSGRWWIEVPFPQNMGSKYHRHALIPCSYADYQEALEGEIPERWWRAFYKLS